jgi:hypothetical protein
MHDEPRFSEAEWALMTELLEHEHEELPSEIHHTHNKQMREELQHRAEMVQEMLGRLHMPMMA